MPSMTHAFSFTVGTSKRVTPAVWRCESQDSKAYLLQPESSNSLPRCNYAAMASIPRGNCIEISVRTSPGSRTPLTLFHGFSMRARSRAPSQSRLKTRRTDAILAPASAPARKFHENARESRFNSTRTAQRTLVPSSSASSPQIWRMRTRRPSKR